MELQGKVALVTGAGSGIVRHQLFSWPAPARRSEHSDVPKRAPDNREPHPGQQRRGHAVAGRCRQSEEMSRAVDDLVKAHGRLDIVITNAGINGVWAPIDELAPEEWDRTIVVNLRGTFLTLRSAVPRLKHAGGGSVVIIASINGTRTFTGAGATAYACSKAAQLALGQMAAVELGKHGIRVNVICPGAIETEIGDNTQQRNTEAAEVPAEYPAGGDPADRQTPWPRRGRCRAGAVPIFPPLASHQRLPGLGRRGAVAPDVGCGTPSRVTAHAGQTTRPFRPSAYLAPGFRYWDEAIPRGGTRDRRSLGIAGLHRLCLPRHVGRRRVVSFGWSYDFDSEALRDAPPIPPFLLALLERVAHLAGLALQTLSQALVTDYPPGATIGWHRDKPVFGDVIGISLGVSCLFRLRRRAEASWQRASLRLEPRSAYLLQGPARTEWEHSIPPVERMRHSVNSALGVSPDTGPP